MTIEQSTSPNMQHEPRQTWADVLKRASERLSHAGVEDPVRDARILLCAAGELKVSDIISGVGTFADAEALSRFSEFVRRRAEREPVSRILGTRAFWKHDFVIGPDVLDPRPDTETIIETAVELLKNRSNDAMTIADFGTGSGALLCSLLCEFPNSAGVAVDISAGACAVAEVNIERLGLAERAKVVCGGWSAALPGPYDLIVSNPPYIEKGAIEGLQAEVRRWDPLVALDGGPDGLSAYRELAPVVRECLKPGGICLIELGAGQFDSVADICRQSELDVCGVANDLSGIPRTLILAG